LLDGHSEIKVDAVSDKTETTLRQEVAWLLDQLGQAELADRIGHSRKSLPAATLTAAEWRVVHRYLRAHPEPFGPPLAWNPPPPSSDDLLVTVRFPAQRADGQEERQERQVRLVSRFRLRQSGGLLQSIKLEGPGVVMADVQDLAEPRGSFDWWLSALGMALRFDLPPSTQPRSGGRPSPLDVRLCLRQLVDALRREGKASATQAAKGAAILLVLRGQHEQFWEQATARRFPQSFRIHDEGESTRAYDRQKEIRRAVAALSDGVFRKESISLLAEEVRSLTRERKPIA
jgi:hypothetical protein